MIDKIKKLKNDIKKQAISSGINLEKKLYEISNKLWKDILNINEDNLNNISLVHNFLIEEVCSIHEQEEDLHNAEIYKNNLSFRCIKNQLIDGSRAFNIYSFNDEIYEYYFVGDIHSDVTSLRAVLNSCNFFNAMTKFKNIRLIFLGDYVDRGKSHLETMELVLLLKYLFPQNCYLLKGNHDGGYIDDGVVLCVKKQESVGEIGYFLYHVFNLAKKNSSFTIETVSNYIKFFNSLCNVALVGLQDINVIGVHGGIPRPKVTNKEVNYFSYIKSLSQLADKSIVDELNKTIFHNMLWSDPKDIINEESLLKARFNFNQEHFNEFINTLGVDYLVRGHEAVKNGVMQFFNGRLYTVFSSGKILNKNNENVNIHTAYSEVYPKILKLHNKKEFIIVPVTMEL
ncbi:serine/threonine protein phosphatase [Clostridium sp. CS001]|uniref:metallophosphoesterase family protein n=1 Tax=Clostridium sp. CS001 TaxID=2880648 RepID=UPI001CF3FD99|nr:metallophosphoesterase family protein [Clostridium sp. CS001]MCB2291833.1 serine/threonine protein phosphatase [Clostridium sp. CS001]